MCILPFWSASLDSVTNLRHEFVPVRKPIQSPSTGVGPRGFANNEEFHHVPEETDHLLSQDLAKRSQSSFQNLTESFQSRDENSSMATNDNSGLNTPLSSSPATLPHHEQIVLTLRWNEPEQPTSGIIFYKVQLHGSVGDSFFPRSSKEFIISFCSNDNNWHIPGAVFTLSRWLDVSHAMDMSAKKFTLH